MPFPWYRNQRRLTFSPLKDIMLFCLELKHIVLPMVVPSPGSQRIYREVQTNAAIGITLLLADDYTEQIDTNARDYTEPPH